ncbi:hypothetical protein D3C75_808270 [compost metagenome]
MIAEILRVGEVCLEQHLRHFFLLALLFREMCQTVSIELVAQDHGIEPVSKPDGPSLLGYILCYLNRLFPTYPVFRRSIIVHVSTCNLRHMRVNPETPEDKFDLIFVGKTFQSGFELTFADVAERAAKIRPNFDFNRIKPPFLTCIAEAIAYLIGMSKPISVCLGVPFVSVATCCCLSIVR